MAKEGRIHARGDVREDGLLFWHYYEGRPRWVTPEKFRELSEKQSAHNKKYRERNREKLNKYLVDYREKNKEIYWMYRMLYYEAFAEEKRALSQKWRDENKGKNYAMVKRWRKQNPGKDGAYKSQRKARKKKAMPENAWLSVIDGIHDMARRITKCLGITHHVDHIVPLSCGGMHDAYNLQILPALWNHRKRNNPNYELPDCYLTPARLMSR